MLRAAALYGGSAAHHRSLHEPKYGRWFDEIVYLPDAPARDLTTFDAVVVPERLHAGALAAVRTQLLALLDRGATVVLFGEQSVYGEHPDGWLPGIRWEPGETNYWWWREPEPVAPVVAADPDHPLFDRAEPSEVIWHHHGALRPPAGAHTVLAARGGGAVLYTDEVSTAGRLVVAALDPMSHYGGYFMPATERFLDVFLPWLVADGAASTRG